MSLPGSVSKCRVRGTTGGEASILAASLSLSLLAEEPVRLWRGGSGHAQAHASADAHSATHSASVRKAGRWNTTQTAITINSYFYQVS